MEVWKKVIIDNIECDYEISNHGNLRCKNTLEPRKFNTHRGCYTCKDVSNQISRSCKKSGLYRGYIWKFV